MQADYLFLLTDVDCLYTTNPKDNPDAQPIWEVENFDKLAADTSTQGTQWGTGGMATKLTAGRIATAAGTTMVICNSQQPENIIRVRDWGGAVGLALPAKRLFLYASLCTACGDVVRMVNVIRNHSSGVHLVLVWGA